MTKLEKIEKLVNLHETLITHTSELTEITRTLENTKNNIEKIIKLNEFHKQTRELAKVILEGNLNDLSSNFIFKLLSKDLKPTSIKFVNLVTFYNEKLIEYYNSGDDKNLQMIIDELHDFDKTVQKSFKSLTEKLKLLK